MADNDSLSYFLPDTFKYAVIESRICDDQNFDCHLRIALKDMDDFKQWLQDFEKKTNTGWILRRSKGCDEKSTYVVNRNYVCQHSSYRKKRKTEELSKKDKCCEAAFSVRIKRNNSCIRYSDPHVKLGLTAVVKIASMHTHPVNDAESWNWLRRSQETRDIFIAYFEKGMSPAEAAMHHQNTLLLEDSEHLENRRENPPKPWIYFLYDKWNEEKSNDFSNSGYDSCYQCEEEDFPESSAPFKTEVLQKWDEALSGLRTILMKNLTDITFTGKIELFIKKCQNVRTKNQMCSLLGVDPKRNLKRKRKL